jgi:hypothetical protein
MDSSRRTIRLVSAHEKDYLLAGQGNDALKAPHHTSREKMIFSFDNPGERVTCWFCERHLEAKGAFRCLKEQGTL